MEQINVIAPKEYYFESTQDILIEVFPSYVPERSAPENNQFFYSYRIQITNNGPSRLSCYPPSLENQRWKW